MTKISVIIGCVDGALIASDRAAVTLAVMRFGNDVVACCPHGEEVAQRYALGAGVRGIVALEECAATICLVGRGGAGTEGDLMAARLAMAHEATLVLDVLDVQTMGDNFRVWRDLGRGAQEVLTLTSPAVLMVADDAPQRMYVSRYRQNRAAITRLDIVPPQPVSWEPARPRAKTADLAGKTRGTAQSRMFNAFGLSDENTSDDNQIVDSDAEACAEHLVRYLAHHGFVERGFAAAAVTRQKRTAPLEPTTEVTFTPTILHSRAPHPVNGSAHALQRRPRPYQPTARPMGKFARGPRPLGQEWPASTRRPFPLSTGAPIDG